MKKVLHYFLAFLIPILIFCLAMYFMNLYPFGDQSFRITDASSQYPAFFEGLRQGNLFTFKIGLGANFYPIFTTYLANPINLVYFLFKNYQFEIFFFLLIIFKIGLIGLSMNILLNYKNGYNKWSLLFSTIYSLCGFVSLYYFNYQFLDALYMLPLIMIGIDKIVSNDKNLMYFITLTLMIIFHYYTAYMICVFSVIYFCFLLYNKNFNKKIRLKKIKKFFITSLFCGLCSSFITIPTFYSLLQGRTSYYEGLKYFAINKNGGSFFYNLTSSSTFVTDLIGICAPVFITLLVIVLIIFTFFRKDVNKKYKASLLIIILLYFLSLSFNLFYDAWHVFQEPVGLPGRFVFTFNAFLVLISYNTFLNIPKIKIKNKIIIYIVTIVTILLSFLYKLYLINFKELDKIYYYMLIFNLLSLFCYIFFMEKKKGKYLITILVLCELLCNQIFSFNVSFAYAKYDDRTVNLKKEKDIAEFYDNLKNNNYLRMETYDSYNSGMFYNYNSVSYYVSIYNNNLSLFVNKSNKNSENSENYMHIISYKSNFLFDSFFGIGNTVYFKSDDMYYEKHNGVVIKSLGFLVNSDDVYNDLNNSIDDIVKLYNDFTKNKYNLKLKELTPNIVYDNVKLNDGIFSLINDNYDGKVRFKYIFDEDMYINLDLLEGQYFTYLKSGVQYDTEDTINVIYNNKKVKSVNEVSKGDKLEIILTIPRDLKSVLNNFKNITGVNKQVFTNVINDLNENVIEDITFNSFGFTGDLQSTSDKNYVVLTIPYDENILIKVDGEKVNYNKILGGIIGFKIPEGRHKIDFEYHIKGLKMGIIISSISLVVFLFTKILEKKNNTRYNNK